jgi:transposase InsO family protein
MCRSIDVSRSGYCQWRNRPRSERAIANAVLDVHVASIHAQSDRTYGRPRIVEHLQNEGQVVGHERIRQSLLRQGLSPVYKRPYRVTTDSEHDKPVAPNVLKRRFDDWQPNQAWVADITYIHTRQGWLYLAVVLDLATRKIVGWSMSERIKARLVCDALTMAYQHARPDVGLIMHTDRGSQYASKKYRKLITAYGMTASMSRKANCWDNGVPRTPGWRCSKRDESVASRILVAGPGSKLRRAAEVKSPGGERRRKGAVKGVKCGIGRRTQVNH